ncbi:MAG TPA: aminotransferase class I/II-fold pyridoxal phosphate-dependent enzyme, partial [Actinomycetota bacterium]|nr:aminotransferase class I/II-fold pyridoxal phosphate-dependent enzyme [Actinomycetota bacterium]
DQALTSAIVAYARGRIANPRPLDHPPTPQELTRHVGRTITPGGLGGDEALRIWSDQLAPTIMSTDHPAFLAFVPGAPTPASVSFDLAVSAACSYGGTWIEGAGAVWAENEVLRWLADLAGLPAEAGGCFVSGGTAGNLAALITARHAYTARGGSRERRRILCADSAHSSITTAARIIDVELVRIPDEGGRLTGAGLRTWLESNDPADVVAVAASAGSTNAGLIDDLAGVADVCSELGIWLHVDGAYGGAALLATGLRDRFLGLERADSFIVDPHKWLFAPYDACALLYRDPETARAAHRQDAAYLETLNAAAEWNPSDFAPHLSRRARGLPLWFSLAVHGTEAYREAVETVLAVTRETAEEIRRRPHLALAAEPELSVVLFRRLEWGAEDYEVWWRRLLREHVAFVQPTVWEGEKVARLCFVNPRTTIDHVRAILDTTS